MSSANHSIPKLENQRDCKVSLLDLPSKVVYYILRRLSPQDWVWVAQLCTRLRDISRSNYLWEKHVEQKWSRLVGNDAYHELEYHTTKYKKLLVDHNFRDHMELLVVILHFNAIILIWKAIDPWLIWLKIIQKWLCIFSLRLIASGFLLKLIRYDYQQQLSISFVLLLASKIKVMLIKLWITS